MVPNNPSRGEIVITLGETDYVMRPTFSVIREIEAALSKSMFTLAGQIATANIGVNELATIVYIALRRSNRKLKMEEVGDLMMNAGITTFLEPVSLFVIGAVNPSGSKTEGTGTSEGESVRVN